MDTRRSFLSGLGGAFAAVGIGPRPARAQQATGSAPPFTPAHHAQDEWLSQIPGKHRVVIDAVTPAAAGAAVLYAANLYSTNTRAYALDDRDLAIVIVMRHNATPFAFTDAVWAKYGKALSAALDFRDPKTKEAPSTNLYNAKGYGLLLPNLGDTIDSVIAHGAHIAICDLASHFAASQVARATNVSADAVYAEFKANTLPNSRFVSAGVVAVTRAQELGYSLVYAG
jgi:hypothetical protein